MSKKNETTRRGFFWKAGAALSAPLALASAEAEPARRDENESLRERLARLEDERAIAALRRAYMERVNAGAHAAVAALFVDPEAARLDHDVRSLAAGALAEHDTVEIAADRRSASSTLLCAVDLETPIDEPGCTLVEMARLQGEGLLRRTEQFVLEQSYGKRRNGWKIERSVLRVRKLGV